MPLKLQYLDDLDPSDRVRAWQPPRLLLAVVLADRLLHDLFKSGNDVGRVTKARQHPGGNSDDHGAHRPIPTATEGFGGATSPPIKIRE